MAETHLKDPAHFVVEVTISKHKPYKVSVILDGDQGINIDQCSELSRALSADLDQGDLIQENYLLEVGTPGLDQPLKLKRQYVKNVGRNLKVVRKDKTLLIGTLTAAHEEGITLNAQQKSKGKKIEFIPVDIPYSQIEKAIVMVSFNK